MEKTSLKLVFLFSLTVIAFCSSLANAREMAKEEVISLGVKYPEGNKNFDSLPLVAHTMDNYGTNEFHCDTVHDCLQFCPIACKDMMCVSGTCYCDCV